MAKRFVIPLGTRIFLLTALLLLLALGVATFVTYWNGRKIADRAVDSALNSSSEAQIILQSMDSQQLGRVADQIVAEPAFVAYLAEASDSGDGASIVDLLLERRGQSAFGFAIVTAPDGTLIARTDHPGESGDDLSSRSVLAEAMANEPDYTAEGVWEEEDELFTVAVAPIVLGFDLHGFLALGFPIDKDLATDISRASGAHVSFLNMRSSPPVVVASSNASPSADPTIARQLVEQLEERGVLGGGMVNSESETVTLAGSPWRVRARPLVDNGGETVGAMVAQAPLDLLLKPFNTILGWQVGAGLLSLLAALVLSYALSRRTLAPIQRLSEAAAGAREGNYDLKIKVERHDEVGRLADSFNSLLSDLRQKQDMELYMTQLSRNLPDQAALPPGRVTVEPEARQTTALAIELRRYARARTSEDPERVGERLARDLRRISTAVASQNGHLGALCGHRLIAWFDGPEKAQRALTAAAKVALAVGSRENAFDEAAPPLLALSSGATLVAPIAGGVGTSTAVVGMPMQKLEALMREATPGDVILTREVHDELEALLAQLDEPPGEGRSLFSPLPVYSLSDRQAAELTGVSSDDRGVVAGEPDQPTLSDIAPGSVVGQRFEIVAVLGAGGMGVVYKARDRELGDFVALKVLKRELGKDPVQLGRLKEEIRLARKVTHPNVLRTYDFGELDGIPFISMEYVRGVTLRFMLDQSDRFPFTAGLRVARQLCAGLAAAHAEEVIHRDIKPENLIIDHAGNARLMDFGIARPVERLTPGLTREGWLVGTPRYLAPEQIDGKAVDSRADIYACGVLLYELFTGELPFEEGSVMELLTQKLKETPVSPRAHWPEMPERLDRAIMTCLQADPDRRFQRVEELLAELDALSG